MESEEPPVEVSPDSPEVQAEEQRDVTGETEEEQSSLAEEEPAVVEAEAEQDELQEGYAPEAEQADELQEVTSEDSPSDEQPGMTGDIEEEQSSLSEELLAVVEAEAEQDELQEVYAPEAEQADEVQEVTSDGAPSDASSVKDEEADELQNAASEDATSDEIAVEDEETSNQVDAPVTAEQVEVKEGDADPAVDGSAFHQALDMISLEQTIRSESPRQKTPKSLSRAASRLTGSFRQGMTRDERLASMINVAEGKARKDRLGEGLKSAFQANMDDIGALGIGMQLYFMLTKYLAVVFVVMGIISLPAIMVNAYGHGITSKMVDPLQLAYSSIGNGGVNSDLAASARNCLPIGDIDCTWETVDTPLTSNPKTVTWIVTFTDILYSFVFMCFLLFYSYRARKAIKEHQTKHLTPARYAVLVRGLPKYATEKEILDHFNTRYDLNKDEEYAKLWFGCCWGRRHKVKQSRSKKAINRNVVSNVDHLEGSTTINKDLYLNTWIAQVSVAHPTGGLLRTFLSMESLGQRKKETEELVRTLEAEKSYSPADFKAADEKLIHASKKKLTNLEDRLEKKMRKIKAIRDVLPERVDALEMKKMLESAMSLNAPMSPRSHAKFVTAANAAKNAAHAAKVAAANTQQAFDWEACECAFVVFNNLESRRRCLQDYRQSSHWLSRKWQPQILRFRDTIPLIVTTAPEPSNILWENLEVTDRGRFYRQFVTNLVTVMLLVISCAIISAAQTTQERFASKVPPNGLCDRSLPAVYYADTSFALTAQKRPILWSLAWDQTATCSAGTNGETRYHIAYSNGIINNLDTTRLSYGSAYQDPERCIDPCISDTTSETCNTLPCFYYDELVKSDGMTCEKYDTSHVVYCFCSTALTNSLMDYGFVNGPKKMWDNIPCRDFTKEYLIKNSFILVAAGTVVIVNFLLNTILRLFAVFERHTSESTKIIRVAVRMFGAQFVNTALIVIVVNASFGLSKVPVAKELLGGKYQDFQRAWYPTVGMGIATTMLLNAFMPQFTLFAQMYIVSPIYRWYKRQSIRTQVQMDKLYAGPTFDISLRYPMVLNSVFVTMVFCGGSPVLLFIAAVASAGVHWFDKLSILHLYSVKTTYDEILGQVTIQVLPWTLALHLGCSAWMYGNAEILKGTMIDLPWLLRSVGLSSILKENPNATTDQLYSILTEKIGKYDVLGEYGFLVKVVYTHVMLMTVLCFIVTLGLVLYTIFGRLVFVVLGQMLALLKQAALFPVELIQSRLSKENGETLPKQAANRHENEPLPVVMLAEFAEPFIMSVSQKYRPEEGLGFQRKHIDNTYELTCVWPKDTIHDNDIERVAGERKLTWETMQAPVKSYAIEANGKYRLAVERVTDAWALLKKARGAEHTPAAVSLGKVMPVLDNQVESAITATEIVSVVTTNDKKPDDAVDTPTEATRPEEIAEVDETGLDEVPISLAEDEPTADNDEVFPDGMLRS